MFGSGVGHRRPPVRTCYRAHDSRTPQAEEGNGQLAGWLDRWFCSYGQQDA